MWLVLMSPSPFIDYVMLQLTGLVRHKRRVAN